MQPSSPCLFICFQAETSLWPPMQWWPSGLRSRFNKRRQSLWLQTSLLSHSPASRPQGGGRTPGPGRDPWHWLSSRLPCSSPVTQPDSGTPVWMPDTRTGISEWPVSTEGPKSAGMLSLALTGLLQPAPNKNVEVIFKISLHFFMFPEILWCPQMFLFVCLYLSFCTISDSLRGACRNDGNDCVQKYLNLGAKQPKAG